MALELNAQDFKFEAVSIASSRGGAKVITKVVSEYEVFEDISKPYCTGSILVQDQGGWIEEMKLMGTERLTVVITTNSGSPIPSGATFAKNWIIHSIERAVKTGEGDGKGEAYLFNLIEEHAIGSKMKKFSKSIGNGNKLEDEISSILQDEMGVTVEKNISPSVQQNWKAIIPYMHPLEAAEWLRDRASTGSGLPFLLMGTLYDTYKVKLQSLDKMQQKAPFNAGDPYVYAGTNVQYEEYKEGYPGRFKQIKGIRAVKMCRGFQQIMSGTCGAAYAMTELDKGVIEGWVPTKYSILDVVGAIPKDGKQNVYDEAFSAQGVGTAHSNDARIIHQVLSRKTYLPGANYKSIHWEADADSHINKIKTRACLEMMMRNTYEVRISGRDIAGGKNGVGDRINIQVPDNKIETEAGSDKLKSGYFLITNTRNVFKQDDGAGLHEAVLTVSKFNEGPGEL
jgi:hypothetical protein